MAEGCIEASSDVCIMGSLSRMRSERDVSSGEGHGGKRVMLSVMVLDLAILTTFPR